MTSEMIEKLMKVALWTVCLGMPYVSFCSRPMPLVNVKTIGETAFESRSPYVLDLAGDWRFRWSGSESRAPQGFQEPTYDVSRWETLPVPSCVEAHGWGSRTVSCASVSSFRRSFTLPPAWEGRKVFLELTGVYGDCTAWVNGRELVDRTNGVYELTKAIYPQASNEIALRVIRPAKAGWSGVCGGVRLFAVPKVELRDFRVTVKPDADYLSAEIEVEADVVKPDGGVSVEGIRSVAMCVSKVFDERGLEVATAPVEQVRLSMDGELTVIRQKLTVDAPRFWSAERPSFYTVAVQVDQDLRARRVAFRDERQRERAVLRAIRVSSADFAGGVAASEEEIVACIRILKRANFNSVVDDGDLPVRFAELCDRHGLYVITNAVPGLMAYADLGVEGSASFEEAKFANRPLSVVCANAATGRAILKNAFTETSASEFAAKWNLTRDGVVVSEGTFNLPAVPGGQRGLLELPLPSAALSSSGKGEFFYNLSFLTRTATPEIEAGYEVAHQQIPYAAGAVAEQVPSAVGSAGSIDIRISEDTRRIEASAGPTKAVFDRAERRFRSLSMNGRCVLGGDAAVRFFADGLRGLRVRAGDLQVEGSAVVVTDELLTEGEAGYDRTVRWQFSPDGKVRVEVTLAPFGAPDGAPGAIGFEWRPIDLASQKITYLGRGPWANRPEACTSASVGLYSGAGAGLAGMRTGVRRLTVADRGGLGVEIGAETPASVEFGPAIRIFLNGSEPGFRAEKWAVDLTPVGQVGGKSGNGGEKEKSSGWFF